MSQTQKICHELSKLPESARNEVLDFIEYLKVKKNRSETKEWHQFSLSRAMRGFEEKNEPEYDYSDIKESV